MYFAFAPSQQRHPNSGETHFLTTIRSSREEPEEVAKERVRGSEEEKSMC